MHVTWILEPLVFTPSHPGPWRGPAPSATTPRTSATTPRACRSTSGSATPLAGRRTCRCTLCATRPPARPSRPPTPAGRWNDVSLFKGPILRGLAARPPFFHNGFAANLNEVVTFYNDRFKIDLTAHEKADLAKFLATL